MTNHRVIRVVAIVGVVLALVAGALSVSAQGTGYNEQFDVNRDGVLDIRDVTALSTYLETNYGATVGTPVPTATPVPQPTVTPVPEPTATAIAPTATPPVHAHNLGVCGELMAFWHPPVINQAYLDVYGGEYDRMGLSRPTLGCATQHEHGIAPPDWVRLFEVGPSFDHQHNTSANENMGKHQFMKGYLFDEMASDAVAYCITHAAPVAADRMARFHSEQCWFNVGGSVSYVSGWNDFGEPCAWTPTQTVPEELRCARVRPDQFNPSRVFEQPATLASLATVVRPSDCDNPSQERWYRSTQGYLTHGLMDFGDSVECFDAATELYQPPSGNPLPPFRQDLWTGGLNRVRSVSLVTYRHMFPQAGRFQRNQFGRPCTNATAVGPDGRTYLEQCATWIITPQVVALHAGRSGPGQANWDTGRVVYDVTGVVPPN